MIVVVLIQHLIPNNATSDRKTCGEQRHELDSQRIINLIIIKQYDNKNNLIININNDNMIYRKKGMHQS